MSENVRREEPLLPRDADLGDQHVPAVPDALRVVQLAGDFDGEPFLGPAYDAARRARRRRSIARVAQCPGQPRANGCRGRSRGRATAFRYGSSLVPRSLIGTCSEADDPPGFELPVLADVDEQRTGRPPRGARGPARGRSRGQARGHRPCPKDNRGRYEPPGTHPGDRRRGDRARGRRRPSRSR